MVEYLQHHSSVIVFSYFSFMAFAVAFCVQRMTLHFLGK